MATSRTGRFLRQRKRIIQLLKNYGDIYMSRQGGFVAQTTGDRGFAASPLNFRVLQRMDNDPIALTFTLVNKYLIKLREEKPRLYSALDTIYLRCDVGERELEYLQDHKESNPSITGLLKRHDQAIDWLGLWLLDDHLAVYWPQYNRYSNQRHRLYDEIEQVYQSFYEVDLMDKTKAVEAVIDYYDGAISITTVWRIVKSGEEAGRLKKRRRKKPPTAN